MPLRNRSFVRPLPPLLPEAGRSRSYQDLAGEEMAIDARHLDGRLSYTDIAEGLGVAEATPRTRIQKLFERIFERMWGKGRFPFLQ
mgnify:CR=1 FL=1